MSLPTPAALMLFSGRALLEAETELLTVSEIEQRMLEDPMVREGLICVHATPGRVEDVHVCVYLWGGCTSCIWFDSKRRLFPWNLV